MWSLDIYNISSPMFLPPPVMMADPWCSQSPCSECGVSVQCCDSGYNCQASWRLIQSSPQLPSPVCSDFSRLVTGQSSQRGWTRVWGENFIKLYHLSCPWPALFCRLVCFREFYGVINYRNTSAVPGYTLFILIRHFTWRVRNRGFCKFISLCVIHDTQRKSFTVELDGLPCSTFPVTLP